VRNMSVSSSRAFDAEMESWAERTSRIRKKARKLADTAKTVA